MRPRSTSTKAQHDSTEAHSIKLSTVSVRHGEEMHHVHDSHEVP